MERKTSTLIRKDNATWHSRQKLALSQPKTKYHQAYRDYIKMEKLQNQKQQMLIIDLHLNCSPQKKEKLRIKHITREK